MSLAAAARGLKTSSIWTSRALVWIAVAAGLSCAVLVLALRYWILPNIEHYREDIAKAVSRAAKVRITIGKISADWEGIRPHLVLENVSVFDKSGRRALGLERVESTIAWRSLPAMNLHFHSLDIYRPSLDVRRDSKGIVSIAGIELQTEDRKRGGFSEWLLEQPDIEVHDAVVSWTDELRQAPPLELAGAYFQMFNRGDRHRFGLRAVPPKALAGPVDVRADMLGNRADLLAEWSGKLFVELESPDLAAWRTWVDIPFELTRGAGGVRSWLTFSGEQLGEIIADVKLSGVRTRLRHGLPELELDVLHGRLSWKNLPSGFEFSTAKLALAGAGVTLPPADFLLRVMTDKQGLQQGELQANALNLPPLVMLADRLPIDNELRAELTGFSPSGSVHDLLVRWNGAWPDVRQYSVRGRFEHFALNRHGKLPGIAGLSGNVDGTEKGGTLHLTGAGASLDMPLVFAAPLTLDTLTAQLGWARTRDRTELRFNNITFANPDAAGTLFGSYRMASAGRGDIDLTASLTRADARAVPRYMPITELRKVRPWLERALVAGQSNYVRFRMKGRLDDFPFKDEKQGIFHLMAKISGGTLDYADRWPRFENVEGDLRFTGTRMEFAARQGTISGVQVSQVQGEIPDMTAHPEVLTISGEAEGATPDFLAFISKSPVTEMIDRFTEGAQAQGTGHLALKLVLPLGELETSSKVVGAYAFAGNHIVFERDVPPLEQATGRIEFTENTVRVPSVSGVFLGGPVTIAASNTRDSTMRATLQGRANIDNVRKAGGPAWMQQLRGATDWRGVLTLRKKVPDLVVESNLQGISSSLPAPFTKNAAESVPLRIERRFTNPQQDRISLAYGDIVKAELLRRNDGKQTRVERGVVRLGAGEVGEPDRPGVWIRGALKSFDFDEWLTLSRGGAGEGEASYSIAGADVKMAEIDFFGRRFNDLAVTASPVSGGTQFTLAAPELEGAATWQGEGKGRLIARLKKLNMPSGEGRPIAVSKPPVDKPLELPALDVIVEQFQYGPKRLGRLELNAVHQDRDWRIERLRLSSPDSDLTAEGVWQSWLTQPRTQLSVKMDVTDVGRTLARWNYPAGVRGGTAKIEGHLSWLGSPPDFDYPTLGGLLTVEAAKGQFLKLEPGIGKLLGIVSLQSLPRRISLDFRDVFSDGFAFDAIAGTLNIDRGTASTTNFRIAGPAARVVMSGEVDLAGETQRLRVRVTPHLSESVSIAGALLGGPVVGAAAFLAQKILKDPIEQLISFEYNVTGSWSDPLVTKAERAAALAPLSEGGP
ncbi:MAG: hypothetical protein V7640_2695 [Betaproteobacteria bacterium]